MPVRSGVTVTDTSHLCQLNALMSPVCLQRATLKVITWSLVQEQEVPLQQTLQLKVHSHRLDTIATVAGYFSFPLFPFPHFFFWKKKNNFDALLTFFFYQFQVFLQEMCLGIEMCNHTLQKWVLAYFIWEVLSEEAILLEIRQEWIPVNNCVHFQQRKWHFNTHKKRNL